MPNSRMTVTISSVSRLVRSAWNSWPSIRPARSSLSAAAWISLRCSSAGTCARAQPARAYSGWWPATRLVITSWARVAGGVTGVDTGNVAYRTVANSLWSGLGSGQPVTAGAGRRALSRELAPSGGVEDCLDEQAGVAAVDAGDGVAKADGCLVGEAGRE